MQLYWKKYHKNIYQIMGFTIGYIVFKKIALLYIAIGLLALLCLQPQYALKLSGVLEKFIQFLGNLFKTIFLFLLFWLIVFPLSVVRRIIPAKKKETSDSFYINRQVSATAIDFDKLW